MRLSLTSSIDEQVLMLAPRVLLQRPDYLDQWLAGKAALRDSTRLGYETHIRLYLRPGLGASWPAR
jgi:hypothetical protein